MHTVVFHALALWDEALPFDADASRMQSLGLFYGVLLLAGLLVMIYSILRPEKRAAPRLASRPVRGEVVLRIIGALALLQVLAVLLHQFTQKAGLPLPENAHPYWIVAQSLVLHLAGLLLIMAAMFRDRLRWGRVFGYPRGGSARDLLRGLRWYLTALPAVWLGSLVFLHVMARFGFHPNLQETALMITGDAPLWMRIYFIALAVLLAPLFEELFFRGLLLPVLLRYLPKTIALILLSLLFAAIHFHVASLAALFIIAYAFGLAYCHTGSILVPITMHALFNGVNLCVLLFLRHGH